MAPLRRTISLALAAAALAAPVALAEPAGKTTLEETIQPGDGAFAPLTAGPAEKYLVRRAPGAKARSKRAAKRRSMVFFGQLTDPQIVDEESPLRVDFIDGAAGAVKSSHRPQEAFGPHAFDSIIRNMNANKLSRAEARGKAARLGFAITTGDLADNQQLNEATWFNQILDGGNVDPSSGVDPQPNDTNLGCNDVTDEQRAAISADSAGRLYTGVQDFDDWRGAPEDRYADYWDPDEAGPQGPYSNFPRYASVLDRAQQPFEAEGLDVPWFISRGNHDGLIQGNAPASEGLFRLLATGCLKVFPSDKVNPADFRGKDDGFLFEQLANPDFVAQLLGGARKVAPDPDRRVVSKAQYKTIVAGNGFQFVDRKENNRSASTASYYAFTKGGVRFIALDTVAEGGGQYGNLDNAQYKWLAKQLKQAKRRGLLAIAYGHHPMESMINERTDENAGACGDDNPDKVGCDADPRNSAPMHRGLEGKKSVRALFLEHKLLAYVAGHIHENQVQLYKKGKRAFWEISTASHIDWPHQSRTIEVMDNRDGTLSLFGTVLEGDAPVTPPAPGSAGSTFNTTNLASLARQLAWNDPQRSGLPASGESDPGEGEAKDRNVELLIRDPRR